MFFPPRRLRALFPLAVWSGAAFLFPHEPLWTGLIAGLGLMGATAVWFADRGSALDSWQQKHPCLPRSRAIPTLGRPVRRGVHGRR
jgi:hypothetical protein